MTIPRPPAAAHAARPDADEHARTWALLPWLVNGRAEGEARERALAHLAHCGDCRAEWQAQQHLASALQASHPDAAALPDAEAGLQRLLGRLDSLPQPQPQPAAPPVMPATSARRANRLQLALAAAVVVQAVGLVVLGGQLLHGGQDRFTPLSQPPAPEAAGSAPAWRVLPDAALTLAQWQALLQAHDLVVVDGPNSAGAYALALRPSSAAQATDTLARLRAHPGVRLAEPLDAPR